MVVDGEEEGVLEKVSEHAFYMSRIKCRVPEKCHWEEACVVDANERDPRLEYY